MIWWGNWFVVHLVTCFVRLKMFTHKCLVYGYSLLLFEWCLKNAADSWSKVVASPGCNQMEAVKIPMGSLNWLLWNPSWTRVTMVPAIDSSWFCWFIGPAICRFAGHVATYDAWIVPREVYCWWCWAAIKRTFMIHYHNILVIWQYVWVTGWLKHGPGQWVILSN